MSLYEFNAAVSGYVKLKSGKADPMTDEDFDDHITALRALNDPSIRV